MSGPRYHRLKGFGDIPFLFPSHIEPNASKAEYLDFAALKEGDNVLESGDYSAVTSIIFSRRGFDDALDADNYEAVRVTAK